jgi:hypothetical protein
MQYNFLPSPPQISQGTTVRSGNCHCLKDVVFGQIALSFLLPHCVFWIGNTLLVFLSKSLFSFVILLSCFCPVMLSISGVSSSKNPNLPQKSSIHTENSNFHVTDFIIVLYVLFIIQESLLNVYMLKVPDSRTEEFAHKTQS